jgi:hypothetical protein
MPLIEPQATDIVLPKGPITPDFRASIDQALANLVPPGKNGALLFVATDKGAVLGVAAKLNDNWAIGGDVEKKWSGDVTGRVFVRGYW